MCQSDPLLSGYAYEPQCQFQETMQSQTHQMVPDGGPWDGGPEGQVPMLHFFSSTPPAPSIVIVTNLFPGRMRFTLPTSSVVLARTPGLGRVCPLKIAASRANPLVSTDLTRRKMYTHKTLIKHPCTFNDGAQLAPKITTSNGNLRLQGERAQT